MALPFTSGPKDRLTFGIEIEFNVATLVDGKRDPDPEDTRQVYGLIRPPGSRPFANDPTPAAGDGFGWINFLNRSIENVQIHIADLLDATGVPAMTDHESEAGKDPLNHWHVSHDPSIEDDPDSDYILIGVEIKSPPYYFSAAALMTVQKVCALLSNHLRIHCDPSCGIHVHVGSARKGFKCNDLKKLMSTIWVFEEHLETLHPTHRVVGNMNTGNLRDASRLGDRLGVDAQSKIDGLSAIKAAASVNEVVDLLTIGYKLAYSLGNLREADGYMPAAQKSKRTIEFRHHESTLDVERVGHWIRLCVGLAEFADSIDDDVLDRFLREKVNASIDEFSVESLLKALRLPAQAQYYGEKIAREASRQRRRKGKSKSV